MRKIIACLSLVSCILISAATPPLPPLPHRYYLPLQSYTHLVKVLPLGDSITVGHNYEPGYRQFLTGSFAPVGSQLDSAGYHEGHAGWKSADILSLFPAVLDYQPDIILLYIGTNDTIQGVPPDRIISNITAALDQVRDRLPDCRVYIFSLAPIRWKGIAYDVQPFNDLLLSLDADPRYTPDFVGIVPPLLSEADLFDGVHLTLEGYQKIGEYVSANILP